MYVIDLLAKYKNACIINKSNGRVTLAYVSYLDMPYHKRSNICNIFTLIMQGKIILGVIWVIDSSRVTQLYDCAVKVTKLKNQWGSPAITVRYQLVDG